METFALSEEATTSRVEWRSAGATTGEPCVMTSGELQMLRWSAVSLDTELLVSRHCTKCCKGNTISIQQHESFFPLIYISCLSFLGAVAITNARFGQGAALSPIVLDNLGCLGTEARLIQCSSGGIGVHNCNHFEDAGVICPSSQTPGM